MAVYAPLQQIFTSAYSGYQLFTYLAGTTTKTPTWKNSTQSSVHTNPIILDSQGMPPGDTGLFITAGTLYKFLLTTPTDSDPPSTSVFVLDNVSVGASGGFLNVVTVTTSPYTVLEEGVYLCDCTAQAITLNLAAPAEFGSGSILYIKKIDSTSNHVSIVPSAGSTIDGNASYTLFSQYDFVVMITDGVNWFIQSYTDIPPVAGSTGVFLQSNGSQWVSSSYTLPTTIIANGQVFVSNGTNMVASTVTLPITATPASGTFIQSNGTNWLTSSYTFPTTVPGNNSFLQSNGTNIIGSTYSFPTNVGATGTMLRSNGSNYIATTSTFADTYATNNLLYSNGANTVQGLATSTSGALITNSSGVPSISSTLPLQVQANITGTGTLSTGTWNATTIGLQFGGTGATSFNSYGVVCGGTSGTNPLQSVSPGSNGQILMSAGGGALPAFQSAGLMQHLATLTASSSASLSYTTLTSTYRYYVFLLTNINVATSAATLNITLSINNGSTYLSAGYGYQVLLATNATATVTGSDSAATIIATGALNNGATNATLANGIINLFNPGIAANCYMTGEFAYQTSTPHFAYNSFSGYLNGTNTVNAIKFAMSAGNISTGAIDVYGVY